MKLWKLLFIGCIILSGCKSKNLIKQNKLSNLHEMMSGSFDSSQQAAQDSSYYNISLHMYPIWESEGDQWLYVEQALFEMQDKPYRQRIYKLENGPDETYISRVYTIPNEKEYIGAWNNVSLFDRLKPDQLIERSGCEVILQREGIYFMGSTNDKTCSSNLRGASYASSKVVIYPNKIESWDQGFDDKGNQVWGATKGGYVFIKQNSEHR